MKDRIAIKAQAKEILRANRGPFIGVYILSAILIGVISGISFGFGALFVAPVLQVATCGFFARAYAREASTVGDWSGDLFSNYGRRLGGSLWEALFVMLWSMLFVIPGIIKALSYSMTTYILGCCPEVKAKDALKLSMKITKGHLGEIFVTALSFIGWELLSILTCGILEIVHVGPYRELTIGGLFQELKANAIATGIATPADFGEAA